MRLIIVLLFYICSSSPLVYLFFFPFSDVMDKGDTRLSDTINKLNVPEKQELLNYVAHWNTNSKTCYPAQVTCL